MKRAAVLAIAVVSSLSPFQAASEQCSGFGWAEACVSNSGDQLDIGADYSDAGEADSGRQWNSDEEAAPPEDAEAEVIVGCEPGAILCRPNGFTVVTLPDVTASDLASFAPARPTLQGEPGGVGVVGMPTNFVARAGEQTLTGTLFDMPVTVRFTPAAYVFAYGDGSSQRSMTGGTSWAESGQPQFSATPTSHAYAERGTYAASVTVEYTAAVDFGSGQWLPVTGTVRATTGGYAVEVYEVRTALVDQTCAENPGGPGC